MQFPNRPPETLIVTTFSDPRGSFSHFWEAVQRSGVRSPATRFVALEPAGHSPRFETEAVVEAMHDIGVERAFIRTEHKAAPRDIESGSLIDEPTVSAVQNTVESLLVQHSFSDFPTGENLVVRELIDLDFCMVGSHDFCHPEVRYIIEDGEILFTIGGIGEEEVCERQYDYLSDTLVRGEPPHDEARRIAAELDDATYAVDFVMDTNGDWYALEAGVNGVRWHDETEQWINMCGHGSKEEFSPEATYGHVLQKIGRVDCR